MSRLLDALPLWCCPRCAYNRLKAWNRRHSVLRDWHGRHSGALGYHLRQARKEAEKEADDE